MSKENKKEFDFEKGIARLEDIVSLFDQGGLSLSEMEKFFIEGMELINQCSDRLDQTELKITALMRDRKDKIEEEPFEDKE